MTNLFWKQLGIAPTEDTAQIDRAYYAKRHSEGASSDLHYAWKLLRDPFYRSVSETYRRKRDFQEAGFFDDALDSELSAPCYTHLNWLTTPYDKILRRISQLEEYDTAQLIAYPPLIMLTTGGFSPIHNGHLDMMESAKNEMIQQGHLVLGGYLSPSHDAYVTTKQNGTAELLDEHRICLCHEAVALSEWLMVDTWEARYLPTAVNFTDIILRLERYLNRHLRLPVPLRVCYVFGSDNAGFTRTFVKKGYCVCVERPGYEGLARKYKQETSRFNAHIAFASPRLEYLNISSSQIRSAEAGAMPERASRYYAKLRENTLLAGREKLQRRYLIRDESEWAVEPWSQGRDAEELATARRSFLHTLVSSITNAYAEAPLPDQAMALRIEVPALKRQAAYAVALQSEARTINLDACTEGTHRLEVSRLFGLADGQRFSMQVTARPGLPPISQQIQSIPPGDYILLDDDIASGQTMRMVMAVFPKEVRILKVLSLLEQTRSVDAFQIDDVDYQDFYDVVDFRDFLFGAKNGGLVTRLPSGELARVPYMAPYVALSARIRLPASQEMHLSRALWRANERFFGSLTLPITLADCDPAAQSLMRYLGFKPHTPVLDMVRWHIETLERTTLRISPAHQAE